MDWPYLNAHIAPDTVGTVNARRRDVLNAHRGEFVAWCYFSEVAVFQAGHDSN